MFATGIHRGSVLLAVALAGCLTPATPPPAGSPQAPAENSFSADDDSADTAALTADSGSSGTDATAAPDPETPTVAEIAANYAAYAKITDKVIQVNPELAMLCVGASQAQVAKAREAYGPHAHTGILIYMNDKAAEAFTNGGSSYPVGSVVVKHKTMSRYRKDGQWVKDADNGVGGMVKRAPGYDPDHGDWEYFYVEDSGPIESGRIVSCVQCHAAAADKGHVFGTWK